jgi:hypothetical protein
MIAIIGASITNPQRTFCFRNGEKSVELLENEDTIDDVAHDYPEYAYHSGKLGFIGIDTRYKKAGNSDQYSAKLGDAHVLTPGFLSLFQKSESQKNARFLTCRMLNYRNADVVRPKRFKGSLGYPSSMLKSQ